MLPDHLKCNILKAQIEAAFRVRTKAKLNLHISSLCNVTNSSILLSSTIKKEAPPTPRGKNSNETLIDRSVLSSYPFMLTHVSAQVGGRLTLCDDVSGPQVSELFPRFSCIQSDSRQDAASARPQPNAREAAAQI